MGRKGSSKHKWDENEIGLLLTAIQDATPMLEHYQKQGYTRTDWWSTVAGMLFQCGGPVVTGKACARRFDLVMSDKQKYLEREDSWEKVEMLVADYEQSILESLDARLELVEDLLKHVDVVVSAIAKDLDIGM